MRQAEIKKRFSSGVRRRPIVVAVIIVGCCAALSVLAGGHRRASNQLQAQATQSGQQPARANPTPGVGVGQPVPSPRLSPFDTNPLNPSDKAVRDALAEGGARPTRIVAGALGLPGGPPAVGVVDRALPPTPPGGKVQDALQRATAPRPPIKSPNLSHRTPGQRGKEESHVEE